MPGTEYRSRLSRSAKTPPLCAIIMTFSHEHEIERVATDRALRFVNELNKDIHQRAASVEPAVATRSGWRSHEFITLRDWRSLRAVVGSAIHTQRHSQSKLDQILKIALRGGMICKFLATTPGVLSAMPKVEGCSMSVFALDSLI